MRNETEFESKDAIQNGEKESKENNGDGGEKDAVEEETNTNKTKSEGVERNEAEHETENDEAGMSNISYEIKKERLSGRRNRRLFRNVTISPILGFFTFVMVLRSLIIMICLLYMVAKS